MQVLREGYCIPFVERPPVSESPIAFASYLTSSERKSFGGGDTDSSQEGSSRVRTSRPRVLQPHICSCQSQGRVSSSDRLIISQQVHSQGEIPNGDQQFGAVGDSEEQLDDVSGSAGCLLSDSDSSRKQEVPSFCLERSSVSSSR